MDSKENTCKQRVLLVKTNNNSHKQSDMDKVNRKVYKDGKFIQEPLFSYFFFKKYNKSKYINININIH